ncbi:MAG TPA: indolepyruvate oxidoreductase subunit beta [candidate division Zixibacteria bacterium]|nr:indolepyruvate oxidoreductase subunit beta [candidate division Zixibacteria bacterium]
MATTSIFITGVGGQGIILASELLSEVALSGGYDVKKSEVHGMAQRGGSVVSAVRFGEKVYSPVISEGEADVLLAFEPLEALRTLHFAKPEGKVIVNTRPIMPATVASGAAVYPQDLFDRIKKEVPDVVMLDGYALAKQAGSTRTVNVVLLGALSNFLPFSEDDWMRAIERRVPPKYLEQNKTAFKLGRNHQG